MSRLYAILAMLNPWKHRRLETYVLVSNLLSTLMVLGVISCMIFLIDFVDISKSFNGRTEISSFTILGLMFLRSPSTILMLLPFAFLFGALVAFVNLNRRSELIAMRAAGISAWRFVTPAAVLAALAGLATIMVLNPVATYMRDNYEQIHSRLEADQANPDTAVYMRQGDDSGAGVLKQTVIRAASQDAMSHTLHDATLWEYKIDAEGVPQFQRRIDAQKAVLSQDHWDLYNAYDSQPGSPAIYYNKLDITSNLNPRKAFSKAISAESTPFWKLPTIIAQTEASGFASTNYRLRLHQLLATPVMFAAMSALGAVFSLRLMRLGGMARLVVSGALLGFAIFFINQILSAMGKAEVIPVILAGWAPSLIALLSAMSLLVYTEDG